MEKPLKIKTINEIQLHFPDLPIIDIWYNPNMRFLKIATYETAEYYFNTNMISTDYWEAFNAIWRNLTYHYSSIAISYEF